MESGVRYQILLAKSRARSWSVKSAVPGSGGEVISEELVGKVLRVEGHFRAKDGGTTRYLIAMVKGSKRGMHAHPYTPHRMSHKTFAMWKGSGAAGKSYTSPTHYSTRTNYPREKPSEKGAVGRAEEGS